MPRALGKSEFAFEILGSDPAGAGLPSRVIVMPDEVRVQARDGRVFINDARDAVVERFESRDLEIALDEDHGMDKFGGSGRATGWITALHKVGQHGLEAEVEWTEIGRQHLEGRIYRYFSPSFYVEIDDNGDKHVAELIGGGLVNRPALQQRELAESQPQEEKRMLKELANLMGIPVDSSEHEIAAKVAEIAERNAILEVELQIANDDLDTTKAELEQAQIDASKLSADLFDGQKSALLEKYADRYCPAEREALEDLIDTPEMLEKVGRALEARPLAQELLSTEFDDGVLDGDKSLFETIKSKSPELPDEAIRAAINKHKEKQG